MRQNLHLSYPNAIDKPHISLQKFASPKFAVFTFDTKNISAKCATRRKVHNSKKLRYKNTSNIRWFCCYYVKDSRSNKVAVVLRRKK